MVNDDWSVIIERLKYFTFTKYLSMCSLSRKQLFWLVDRLLALSCKGCDGLVIGLVRQIKGTLLLPRAHPPGAAAPLPTSNGRARARAVSPPQLP